MVTEDFARAISPFFWCEGECVEGYSVCLDVGEYKAELFLTRADEGFQGDGYDWASLAEVFLEERCGALKNSIELDPEGSMFCAYSSDEGDLRTFILEFKEACEDHELIRDLFSRAVLDS